MFSQTKEIVLELKRTSLIQRVNHKSRGFSFTSSLLRENELKRWHFRSRSASPLSSFEVSPTALAFLFFHPATFFFLRYPQKRAAIKMRCERMKLEGRIILFVTTSCCFLCIVKSLSKPDIIKTHFDDFNPNKICTI